MRLDQWLVKYGGVTSRTKARDLILAQQVYLLSGKDKRPLVKPSVDVDDRADVPIRIENSELLKYVSRGGLKLEGAIQKAQLNLLGLVVLDIGQSTGGFTDCLLQHGVSKVIGVDVGHGQLDERIQKESRVQFFEGINARDPAQIETLLANIPMTVDGIVMDVSFISMTEILSTAFRVLPEGGFFLSLVKPQFELASSQLNKKGIVKDPENYDNVKAKVITHCRAVGFDVIDYFESSITGKDGNYEFFVFCKKMEVNPS